MDICYKIVDAVKKELKLDKLEVKLNPVTSSTRIPLLANGTIDLECGSTTNNAERQKQIAYTNTHFLTASRYVSKKSSKINSIDDLKGKAVVSTSGTTNIKQLTEANAEKKLGANIIPAKDHAEAFLMVETDRAVAFVMDDILLASLVADSKAPDDYVISKDAFSKPEPYGIMLRKDDPALKKVVDAATSALYTGGESQKIYDKWFTQKIPPKGLNLNLADELGTEEPVRQASGTRRIRMPTNKQTGASAHAMAQPLHGVRFEWRQRTVDLRELQLELEHLLRAGPGRDRHLFPYAADRPVADHPDRDACLDDRLDVRLDVGICARCPRWPPIDRLRVGRILPQRAAIGAAVPVVLRAPGTSAAQLRGGG